MKKSFSVLIILLVLMLSACQVVAPVATQTAPTATLAQPAAATSTTEPTVEATLAPTEAPVVEKVEIKYAKNFSL
jgi:starvation-inducible outer membrane lipoprotein